MTVIAATGHRPPKLGGYDEKTRRALGALATEHLRYARPAKVISGMALGWDQAVAAACVVLQIPFVAAVPFEGPALGSKHTKSGMFVTLNKAAAP